MANAYKKDFAEWARDQAFWLRSGEFSQLDTRHLAEEIEDIGASHIYELEGRCVRLQAHLARWQRQSGHRCELWRHLIVLQRTGIGRRLERMPSLRKTIADPDFIQDVWVDALILTIGEDHCFDLPKTSPWSLEQALAQDFFPN
jgi:hypothetical protein